MLSPSHVILSGAKNLAEDRTKAVVDHFDDTGIMLAVRLLISALIVTLAIAALSALATGVQVAAQEPPVGKFRVVPPSGPIGTSVMVSGNFDREITGVRFQCWHSDIPDLGVDVAYTAAKPSPSFTFKYTIPAELPLIQETKQRWA